MTRRIRLTFRETGETVVADLLETAAPQVCAWVWEHLPIECRMLHGMYSGPEILGLLDNPRPLPMENPCRNPLPGEILYWYDAGGSVTAPKPAAEICLAYDRGVILRGGEGIPTLASLFARIPGDWAVDWRDFAHACRRSRWERPQLLHFERA